IKYLRFKQKRNTNIKNKKRKKFKEKEFYNLVKESILRLENTNSLINYDFIVIDEAQDIFDRGLDLFINSFSGYSSNGLKNGTSLILYDIDQSYSNSGRNVSELADLISEYYSHFKLNEVKRSAQNPNIRKLSSEVLENPSIILNEEFEELFPNIKINQYQSLQNVKKHIVKDILTPIRETDSSLKGKDCVILIESTFLQGTYKG